MGTYIGAKLPGYFRKEFNLIQCPQWKSFFIQRILVYHNHLKSKDKHKLHPMLGTLDLSRKVKAQSVDYFKSITLPAAVLAQPAVLALPAAAAAPLLPPPPPEQPPPAEAQPPPAEAEIPEEPEVHRQRSGRAMRQRSGSKVVITMAGGARTTAHLPTEEANDEDQSVQKDRRIKRGQR